MSKEQNKSSNDKTAAMLIGLVQNRCELFRDEQNNTYAKTQGKIKETEQENEQEYTKVLKIRSTEFKELIRKLNYDATKKGLNKNVLDEVINTISTIATYEGSIEEVHLRVCQKDRAIYYDLCRPDWSVVKVTKDGWEVLKSSPISFVRTADMKRLPLPNRKTCRSINKLLKHINIREDELPLLVGWLLMTMQAGNGAYPVLVVNGPAGSGKSTACRMIRALVDPNQADLLAQPSPDNLKVVSTGNHVLAFDNVSKVSPQLSDALCRIATGDHQTIRKLYSDNEAFTISIKKPIVMNGISDFVNRSDLASRSVKISLHKIDIRKTEEDAWKEFNEDLPEIFAALLDGLSHALRNINSVKVNDMTRLADFCRWATASHTAYGWEESVFMDAYSENVRSSHSDTLEASPFAAALVELYDDKGGFHNRPTVLLTILEERYVSTKSKFSAGWVRTAKGVVNQLDNIQTSLEAVGIYYIKYKDRENKTFVVIGDKNFTGYKEFVDVREFVEDMDF